MNLGVFELEESYSVLADYKRWGKTGLECFYTDADCENCTVFKTIGLHKNSFSRDGRCHQPQANQILINKGFLPPEKQHYLEAVFDPRQTNLIDLTISTRLEIFKFVQSKGRVNRKELLAHINQNCPNGRVWDWTALRLHVLAMKKVKALFAVNEHDQLALQEFYAGDPAALKELIRYENYKSKLELELEKEDLIC